MNWEEKQNMRRAAAKRNYPLNHDEMFSQKQPVFPIRELSECYEKFTQENVSGVNSVAAFFNYLLRQCKTDEQIEKELFKRFVYGDIEDIKFGVWLGSNGWQPYDGQDRWINLKAGNVVTPITELFADYKKENTQL